jgi:hypothetical protein
MMGILRDNQYTFLIIPRSVMLRMRNVSEKSCRENQNTHFIFSDFSKIIFFMRYVEKYCRARQTTDDHMAHVHCMLDA